MPGSTHAERVERANAEYFRHLEHGSVRRHLEKYGLEFSGKRVLDVGCGPGHYLVEIARHGPARLVGVDANPDRLAFGAEEMRRRGISGVELVHNEGDALPFETASFDLVLCLLTIPFFQDDEAALRELARVLAPGGTLLLSAHGLGFPVPYLRRGRLKMALLYATTLAYLLTGRKIVRNTLQLVGQTTRRLERSGIHVEQVSRAPGTLGLSQTFTVKGVRVGA